jgi:hypothetical protein
MYISMGGNSTMQQSADPQTQSTATAMPTAFSSKYIPKTVEFYSTI